MRARSTVKSDHADVFLAQARETLTYALQPIVNIHTGNVFGYEALLRGWERLGFTGVQALFDQAANQHRSAAALDALLGPISANLTAPLTPL